MNRSLYSMLRVAVLAVLILSLAPVWPVDAGPASQSQRTTTVRIGYLGLLDSDMARGLSLAIQQLNDSGGIRGNNETYVLELVMADVPPNRPEVMADALATLQEQSVLMAFGPDTDILALPNVELLTNAPFPIITGATADSLFANDTNNNLFRAVAPESVYTRALADYLASVRDFTQLGLIQVGTSSQRDYDRMVSTLDQSHQITPALTIQETDAESAANRASEVLTVNPEAILFYGEPAAALSMLDALRAMNWQGVFVYEDANALLSAGEFSGENTEGVISVDSWTFGATTELGPTFVAQYVAEFGNVPSPLAVAGYDTIFVISRILGDTLPQRDDFREALRNFSGLTLVRGPLATADYPERNLSMTAYVTSLTGNGGARTVAIYDNGVLRSGSTSDTGGVAAVPTATLRPTATPLPSPTATTQPATPTPSFLTATVNVPRLNVRSGPGTVYDRITQIREGEQARIIGHNGDYTWLLLQINGQVGWVTAQFVDIFDPGNQLGQLAVVPPPPTPTPGPTDLPSNPDLVITNVQYVPAQPEPACAFTARVSVTNQGGADTGQFGVATTFIPGDNSTYTGTTVSGLASGASLTVDLNRTLNQSGYVQNLAFVVDLNEEVNEGQQGGEDNNIFTRAFKIDKPLHVQSTTNLTAPTSIDFYGGTTDMTWNGTDFVMSGSAQIGPFTQESYESAHYDQVPSRATAATYNNPQPGVVLAFTTFEGQRGVMRVDGRNASTVSITYRVYNDSSSCQP